jgi:Ca2+-binding EF-hand superfamily protein
MDVPVFRRFKSRFLLVSREPIHVEEVRNVLASLHFFDKRSSSMKMVSSCDAKKEKEKVLPTMQEFLSQR